MACDEVKAFGDLHASLREYFHSSKYSDLIIRCEGQKFKVHKAIVCGQSSFFSKACDGEWKEAVEGVIELKGDDAGVVGAMLHFMYTFEYDSGGSEISPMLFHVRVYSIAEKYEVSALKLAAKNKFNEVVTTCWDMDDFSHVINEIYGSTPPQDRGLRDIVVEVAHAHIVALLKKDDFNNALQETLGFAADLAQLLAKTMKTYKCPTPNCGRHWQAILSPGITYYCLFCGTRRSDWENYVER